MRALAATLTPLLLLGSLRAQEPGPAEMVARIFEETRPLAEALWRDYQAANEDESFSGQMSDLAGWPHFVERVDDAAAIRFAADFAPDANSSRYGYGLLAMNVAMGWLHCEYLPEQQLVRLGSTQDPPDAEWDPYVRVVQLDSGVWRIACWPPVRLEDLFSQREKFPDRLSLTIVQETDGFRLQHRGTTLADSRDPAPERWERFDHFLQDDVWPSRRIGERGESLDGVLIRVPAAAPVTVLLEVLARLGQPGRRVPDVQLWVTGGDFPTYFELDQRGAWGEDPEVVPLEFSADLAVGQAVEESVLLQNRHDEAVAFVLPWLGTGPDPVQFMRERTQELLPIIREFWMPWFEDHRSPSGASLPPVDDPELRLMCERAAQVLVPHVSSELPRIAPDLARRELGFESVLLTPMLQPELLPPGNGWILQEQAVTGERMLARVAYRNSVVPTLSPLPVAFLRLEGGAWKFCSWDRRGWLAEERLLPHQPNAPPYVPTERPLDLTLSVDVNHLRYRAGYELQVEGVNLQSLHSGFAVWMETKYPYSWFTTRSLSPVVFTAIHFEAEASAPQEALIPLLVMMMRSDCAPTELRLQVVLDDLGRPGELVFDQSLTRPGADATGALEVRLTRGDDLQQLCDRMDPLLTSGARRFYLLPPE